MAPDCVGAEVQAMVDQLQSGQVQISNMAISAHLQAPSQHISKTDLHHTLW